MSSLFWNTISDDMKEVLLGFMKNELANRFYLAGGTALSLQIGHRVSVDLDFFSPSEDIPSIRSQLETALFEILNHRLQNGLSFLKMQKMKANLI